MLFVADKMVHSTSCSNLQTMLTGEMSESSGSVKSPTIHRLARQ